MDVLARTGALDYARRCAVRESETAAACVTDLPPSPHRESLLELASFAARRTY
jgi:octaprenyl-diphosphate synthase